MTLRVLFDSQIFCAQQFGGISRYFTSIAREMWQHQLVTACVVAPWHVNEYAEHLPSGLLRGRRVALRYRPLARATSLLAGAVANVVKHPDIVHHTYYYPAPPVRRNTKRVLTVYDMTHEREPSTFSVRDPIARWKAAAVASADHIICISHHTRRDLIELLGVAEHKISVTHLGYDELTPYPPADASTAALERPYLLFVGARGGYKNFHALLNAYARSPWLRAHFDLLCFGGGPFTSAEADQIVALGVAASVRQTGGADAALAHGYQNAAMFVYPSRYEGFGIPPLEAMSLGCPVASSNATSLPEVVGDAAALFDPTDVDAMRETLEATLGSADALARLVVSGRQRSASFSWARCARETEAVYERITRS